MNRFVKNAQSASATEKDPRWASVVARSADADGTFYYAVKTTGVYCRPSCAARLARPEHVQFHATCADAEKAGFRPCKRCQPNQPALAEQHAAMIAEACRLIAASEEAPDLEALANHVGMSRYHFHRVFKAIIGLTPHNYVVANRMQKVRKKLGSSETVTEAMYDAGYNSSGCFYETTHEILGMTPSHFRAGGVRTDIRFATRYSGNGIPTARLAGPARDPCWRNCELFRDRQTHQLTKISQGGRSSMQRKHPGSGDPVPSCCKK